MMDAVRLLDFHRKAILSDADAFSVLSLILREGAKDEDELAQLPFIPGSSLKGTIRTLYQSGLLETTHENRLDLTDYAKLLLGRFGVVEKAAQSFVASSTTTDWQRAFLHACIEAKSESNPTNGIQYLNRLKGFRYASSTSEGPTENSPDYLRALYVLVVGLDPESRMMGESDYLRSILSWHQRNKSPLYERLGKKMEEEKLWLISSCKLAVEDAITCDKRMSSSPWEWMEYTTQVENTHVFCNHARLFSAALENDADPFLASIYWRKPELSMNVAVELTTQSRRQKSWLLSSLIQRRLTDLFGKVRPSVTTNKGDEGNYNDTVKLLADALTMCLQQSHTSPNNEIFRHWYLNEKRSNLHVKQTVTTQIRNIAMELQSGNYDNLSRQEKQEILYEVSSLASSMEDKFSVDDIS